MEFGDLGVRVLSSLVMAAVGLTSLWVGGPLLAGVLAIAVAVIAWEVTAMHWSDEEGRVIGLLGGILPGLALFSVLLSAPWWVGGILILASVALVVSRPSPVVVLGALALILIGFWGLATIRSDCGATLAFFGVLVAIATDTGGYALGRAIGGPKLWPRVSPNKTWSGVVGGWGLAMIVGMAFWATGLMGVIAFPLAMALSMVSQAGDLAESAMKRRVGAKDGSHLVPGHGGLVDRFDGLIAACCLGVAVCSSGMLPGLVGN